MTSSGELTFHFPFFSLVGHPVSPSSLLRPPLLRLSLRASRSSPRQFPPPPPPPLRNVSSARFPSRQHFDNFAAVPDHLFCFMILIDRHTAAPYAVDAPAAEVAKEPAAAAASTETPAVAAAPAATAEPTPAPKEEQTVTPTPAAAAAPAASTPAAKKEQPKKKSGLFASCCGGSAKNYD